MALSLVRQVCQRSIPRAHVSTRRHASTKAPTAVVMMNMGGPRNVGEVHDFLSRLFHDRDLMKLPAQQWLAPRIAKRRTPDIQKQYAAIGGGSPILKWTEEQGAGMAALLDELSPQTAPHKPYVMFRYAHPLTEHTLQQMKADGVQRAVAFTQYPQYSCSTTGSSLNQLVRELKRLNMTDAFEWSVIDRWPNHQTHVAAVTETITAALAKFPADKQKDVVILFSAHSLPMRVVNRGDTYPKEVAATVQAVMDKLGHSHAHRLVWQSKVGFLPWLGAQTEESILGYHALGVKNLLLVPIAFTSDHIETLYELDIEYGQELVHKLGDKDLHIVRAESLNGSKTFIRGLAELVQTHLASGAMHSKQLEARCPMCTTESCADMRSFFVKK